MPISRARTRQNTTWGNEANHPPDASSWWFSCGNHIGTLTAAATRASQRVESKTLSARTSAKTPYRTSSQPSGSGSASYFSQPGDGSAGKYAVPTTITMPMAILWSGDMAQA